MNFINLTKTGWPNSSTPIYLLRKSKDICPHTKTHTQMSVMDLFKQLKTENGQCSLIRHGSFLKCEKSIQKNLFCTNKRGNSQ